MAIIIDTASCTGCESCVDACPLGAIEVNGFAQVDEDVCCECGACLSACPEDAISL